MVTLAKKIKVESKNLADIEKTCERQKEQLNALTELKKQQKALQTSINTFYREWNAPQATVPAPARTKAAAKPSAKKPAKAKSAQAAAKKASTPKKAAKEKQVDADPAAAVPQQELFTPQLQSGDQAPAFEIKNDSNNTVTLSQFAGKRVVLYFYPKDDTPGCTQQAKDFTQSLPKLVSTNTVVLGVSRDSVESHQRFKQKHELSIDLLADTEEQLCQAYGVIKNKNRYGKMVRYRAKHILNQ